MSNLNNVQRRLAEGTSSWLLFEFHAQRGDLFSEKYLATPLGQILTGLFPGRIKAEVIHPQLSLTGRGRPPQVDFVVFNDDQSWKFVVESKWLTSTPVSLAQIFWDLIRLELLVFNSQCSEAYFVIAGFAKKFDVLKSTHFYDPNTTQAGLHTYRKGPSFFLDLTQLPQMVKNSLNDKLAGFPGITVPHIMRFDIPHVYPENTINMTFKTFVWKVNSYNKRPRLRSI